MIFSLLHSPIDFLAVVVGFLLIGIPIHEFAHAYFANRFGDPTAKMEGRLTLNPMAHLDPIGTILFFLVGFGWGRPVPINPQFFHKKSDELKVSIAGIIANLLVATLIAIPIRIAIAKGIMIDAVPVYSFLRKLVEINVVLAAFNIIPIPPLDGSHFIEYFLDEVQKIKFQYYGQYILLGLVLYDMLTGQSILLAIMEPIIRTMLFLVSGFPMNSIF